MSTGAILGTIGIVIAVVAIGMLIDRRWGILPRPGELAAAGDAKAKAKTAAAPEPPGTAAAAPMRLTPKKLAAALTAQRCAGCGARVDAGPGEPIRYADAELQLFRLTCAQCGAARGLYVAVV
jgi:hypothetical protein